MLSQFRVDSREGVSRIADSRRLRQIVSIGRAGVRASLNQILVSVAVGKAFDGQAAVFIVGERPACIRIQSRQDVITHPAPVSGQHRIQDVVSLLDGHLTTGLVGLSPGNASILQRKCHVIVTESLDRASASAFVQRLQACRLRRLIANLILSRRLRKERHECVHLPVVFRNGRIDSRVDRGNAHRLNPISENVFQVGEPVKHLISHVSPSYRSTCKSLSKAVPSVTEVPGITRPTATLTVPFASANRPSVSDR